MAGPARSKVVRLAAAVLLVAGGLGAPGTVRADTTLSFDASADVQVYSSNPSTNYGTLGTIRTREGTATTSDPTYRTYLRFDLAGISGAVTGVTLRLYVTDASPNTQGVYAVAGGWTETGLTWANAPAIGGTALGAASVRTLNAYDDIPLGPASVTGDGSIWLGIQSAGTDSAIFSSREGANRPQLVVTVGGPAAPPVADFSGTPTSGNAPLTVAFTDLSTNGPTSWTWDFGDPASGSANASTLRNPSHQYASAGTYDVTLSAANTAGPGSPVTKTGFVTVATPPPPPPPVIPVADFSGTPTSGNAPLTVAFTDLSTNGPTSWTWDFGDPASGSANASTLRNPSHQYASAGTYDVTLSAANTAGPGSPVTKTGFVTVATPPPPPPGGDPVLVGAGDVADCSRTQDSKTAALLAGIAGTVFAAGDLTYPNGTTAEFANCYDPTWGAQKARTRPVVGNHEYNTTGAAPYYAYWGSAAGDPKKGYYSYNIGAWHAVVLNSNCSKVGGCGAGSAQETWLRADLAASSARCTIAFWHHARFSSSRTTPDSATLALWQALYANGADLAIAGHYHNYERFAPQTPTGAADPATGIREFVVGTGGASLAGFGSTTMANSQVKDRSTYGVLKLTLHASGYDFQFIPIAGQTFTDSGSGTCHDRPVAGASIARAVPGAAADLAAGPDGGILAVPDPDDIK